MSAPVTTPVTTLKPIPAGLTDESKLLLFPGGIAVLCLLVSIVQSVRRKDVQWFGIIVTLVVAGAAAALIWKHEDAQDKRERLSGWLVSLTVCWALIGTGCALMGGAVGMFGSK